MSESVRKNLLQMVLPGAILFSALGYMHGPAYLAYAKQKVLAYTMQRDAWWGSAKYNVRLKQSFDTDEGDSCMVYLLNDQPPIGEEGATISSDTTGKADKHEKILLVDKFGEVVDSLETPNVGAIRSTYLMPREGYAMLEVVRNVPESRDMAQVVQYRITGQEIAMLASETREIIIEQIEEDNWSNRPHFPRRHGWSRDGEGSGEPGNGPRRFNRPDWTPEQFRQWRERQRARARKNERPAVAISDGASRQKEDMQRAGTVRSDDE